MQNKIIPALIAAVLLAALLAFFATQANSPSEIPQAQQSAPKQNAQQPPPQKNAIPPRPLQNPQHPKNSPAPEPPPQKDLGVKEAEELVEQRPARGFGDANVTIVEFSDFECPFTKKLNPTIDKLMSDYGGRVKRVFMHYPLRSIHPNSEKAAEAAECAADQGKFWEYHDRLFEGSGVYGKKLAEAAESLSLDMERFNSCLESGEKRPLIERHILLGEKNGVEETPTFFINRVKIAGIQPYSVFKAAVDSALAANS